MYHKLTFPQGGQSAKYFFLFLGSNGNGIRLRQVMLYGQKPQQFDPSSVGVGLFKATLLKSVTLPDGKYIRSFDIAIYLYTCL